MIEGLGSTIIPVYNRAGMLREAVASVLARTHRPIEIIIVDDGSTDDTARVADEFVGTYPQEVRGIHQPNTGPGLAREAGRQAARGEFIQYLDSNDLLLSVKFANQIAGLRAHPECGVSYGKTRYRHADGRVEGVAWKGSGAKVEAEFSARALAAGEKIWFEPEASICHLKSGSGGTRSYGDHLKTIRPSHSVGAYYCLLRSKTTPNRLLKLFARPMQAIRTRHHLLHP